MMLECILNCKGESCASLTTRLQSVGACVPDSRSPSRGCNVVMCPKCILNTGPDVARDEIVRRALH